MNVNGRELRAWQASLLQLGPSRKAPNGPTQFFHGQTEDYPAKREYCAGSIEGEGGDVWTLGTTVQTSGGELDLGDKRNRRPGIYIYIRRRACF